MKKWLGIEGVKITIEVPEKISMEKKRVDGKLIFESRQDSEVESIRLRIVERFMRGRRGGKLINEYLLGESEVVGKFTIKAEEPTEIEFALPFKVLQSDMDRWESKNLIFKGLIKTAKWVRGVKSVFRIEVEADVKGMAISPLLKKDINLIS
ncbi:hypothetical protein [Membranihabitans maritimus]|uniref:hypothetical protein n=1 Tax=Membranihabitans maritimus TaxID=2904244 RepID=UPI001F1A7DDA|nr:hypothetical protein [Membranihabitans maritimus]